METKKTSRASLENKRALFLETGLIAALLLTIGAFSFSTPGRKAPVLLATAQDVGESEIIPITRETPPEPPAAPSIPVFSEVLEIVDDDIQTQDVILFDDTDIDVPIYDYREDPMEDTVEEEDIPFVLVEQKPTFQGGDANRFSRWIAEHVVYPEVARETGIAGRVIIQFTVRKDGSVGDIQLLRGVDPILDREAMRVVASSPRWEPGRQRDRAVNVTYQFPVIFDLR